MTDLKTMLFESCYAAVMEWREAYLHQREGGLIEEQKLYGRFQGLYTLIEKAGLESEYAEWKTKGGHGDEY